MDDKPELVLADAVTEMLDKLYLEWSQFTKAETQRESDLLKRLTQAEQIVVAARRVEKMLPPVMGATSKRILAEALACWDKKAEGEI